MKHYSMDDDEELLSGSEDKNKPALKL